MRNTKYVAMTTLGPAPVYDTESTTNDMVYRIDRLEILLEFVLKQKGYNFKELLGMDSIELEKFLNRESNIDEIINDND